MPRLRRVPRVYRLRDPSTPQTTTSNTSAAQPRPDDHPKPATSILDPLDQPQSQYHPLHHPSIPSIRNGPTTRSQSRSISSRNHASLINIQSSRPSLLHLPTELIFHIAELLIQPTLSIDHWDHPSDDLLNLSSTCRFIRHLSKSLLFTQITLNINSDQRHTLSRTTRRIKRLTDQLSNYYRHHPSSPPPTHLIKKLLIKDDAPDTSHPSRDRRNWYSTLIDLLNRNPLLNSIEFFGYSTNLERVTERSPYQLLAIDPQLLISLNNLPRLKTLYLSGIRLPSPSSYISNDHRLLDWSLLNFNLTTLHLIAIHDSILPIVRRSPNLVELNIWRDFLIGYPTVDDWFSQQHWASLQNLRLKGFYGNSVTELQNTLRDSRRMMNTSGPKVKLHTLDLDEPYSTTDVLRLLDAFKSDVLKTLKVTLWRDENFSPSLFEKLAIKFPNLEDFQIVLETPLRRWWPHKLNAWADSLASFKKLRRFTWNCSPFTCHDFIHVQAGMKSQVMILGQSIPTLERVSYVDISGWLEIERRSAPSTSTKFSRSASSPSSIKSIRWAGIKFPYPFLSCAEFFGDDGDTEDDIVEQDEQVDYENVTTNYQSNQDLHPSNDHQQPSPGTPNSFAQNQLSRKIELPDPFSADRSSSSLTSSLTSTLTLLSTATSSSLSSFSPSPNPNPNSVSNSSSRPLSHSALSNHLRLINTRSYSNLLLSQILALAGSSSKSISTMNTTMNPTSITTTASSSHNSNTHGSIPTNPQLSNSNDRVTTNTNISSTSSTASSSTTVS